MASTSSEEPDHRPRGPDDAEEALQAERGDAGLPDAPQAERGDAGLDDAPKAERGDAGLDDAPKEERSDAAPLAKAGRGFGPTGSGCRRQDCAAWRRRRRKPKESPWWVANQKQRGSAAVLNLLDKGVEHRTRFDTTPTEQVLPDLAIQE